MRWHPPLQQGAEALVSHFESGFEGARYMPEGAPEAVLLLAAVRWGLQIRACVFRPGHNQDQNCFEP